MVMGGFNRLMFYMLDVGIKGCLSTLVVGVIVISLWSFQTAIIWVC